MIQVLWLAWLFVSGPFTTVALGESLLSSANAIIEALHDDGALGPLISLAVLALVVTAALWWIYFWPPHHKAITGFWRSLQYGYTHYFILAAAAALSAGIEVEIDVATEKGVLTEVATSRYRSGRSWSSSTRSSPCRSRWHTVILVGIVAVLVMHDPRDDSHQSPQVVD